MLHQLRVRVLIAYHGGAHLLQDKPDSCLLVCQGAWKTSFCYLLVLANQVRLQAAVRGPGG